ncbi:MAG TPA: aminoglycoside phosphotransferase family protein [Gemmatimonadaceae bacterium]
MLSHNTRRWVEEATGGAVISIEVLPGATSSLLHAIEIEAGNGRHSIVLRRFTDKDWVKRERDLAIREGRSLQHAVRAGLAAPALIAVDPEGAHCGVPATLMRRLPGVVVLQSPTRSMWIEGLARAAADIHRIDAAGFPWKYARYNSRDRLAVPAWSHERTAWKTAIEAVQGPEPDYRECFVHRDYHPSNVLWENGRVSGVVDWVNGCRGPAAIDVAWCRHNLANLHGVGVADEFLAAYTTLAPDFRYDPYWDLMSVVELLPGPPTVYEGWRAGGVTGIDAAAMRERVDAYVVSVVARL